MQFGVFDHIEPVPNQPLDQIYRERLVQIERLESAGFYAYHLAEHHTPAVHSLAPSQNVFLAAVSERTSTLRFGPCVYVLPLHHPVRLIEEISMLDNLSGGRMEIGVGRGGVLEAHFWGQETDVEINQARYLETLEIVKEGLTHDALTYEGEFYNFDELPMRLRPKQSPYPPMWYMRNVETAAINGMNTVVVGSMDGFAANVQRYRKLWDEHQGVGSLTLQGTVPKIGLVVHMLLAETDEQAIEDATPAWDVYRWNLAAPRRLEAEKRGLEQFLGENANPRPANLPPREARRDLDATLSEGARKDGSRPTRSGHGGVGAGFGVLAGSPESVRVYMDEYVATGANYLVCSFQWGSLSHQQAMRSIDLFATEVMPHYTD